MKYMHDYLVSDRIVTLCYPGFKSRDFMDISAVFDIVPTVSVSIHRFLFSVMIF